MMITINIKHKIYATQMIITKGEKIKLIPRENFYLLRGWDLIIVNLFVVHLRYLIIAMCTCGNNLISQLL